MKRSGSSIAYCLLSIILLLGLTGCELGFEKKKIANAVREYMTPKLDEHDEFQFIGLSNRRDTLFMGVRRPCAGVIYKVKKKESGNKECCYAEVIFTKDYTAVISMKELDFDPFEYTKEKISTALKEAKK